MTTLALLIAILFSIFTGIVAYIGLTDKIGETDDIFNEKYYPNPQMWEYYYIKALSVVLGASEFAILFSLFFETDFTFSSIILESIVGLILGYIIAVIISQILFCLVIDGVRAALRQRKKCLDAIKRGQQIV